MLAFLVCVYCAIADRVRGGFPSDRFWKIKPWWKPPLRSFIWYVSGGVLAACILNPHDIKTFLICVIASILFALGERQNMGVIGWIYPTHSKQLLGWLHQFRIGAVWALIVSPLYFFDERLVVLIPACFFGPVLGALFARFLWVKLPPIYLELDGQWAWTEFYRGLFMALIAIVFHHYLT
jgi:hypothetical protein